MKKAFSIIVCALALSLSVFAQDSRGRSTDTIVGDVLARMPEALASDLQSDMLDLAAAAPESVVKLAAMLVDPSEGENSRVEYALNGLANFANAPGNEQYRAKVIEGFDKAIAQSTLEVNTAFLKTLRASFEEPVPEEVAPAPSKAAARLAFKESKGDARARCEALYGLEQAYGSVPESFVLASVADPSRKVRGTALRRYAPATDDFAAKLARKFKRMSPEAKVDVVNWLGDNHISSQLPLVLSSFASSDDALCSSAIEAAGKIGGDNAADALIGMLGNNKLGDKALKALMSYPGPLGEKVEAAMQDASGEKLEKLAQIAGSKNLVNCADKVLEMAAGGSEAALKALGNIAREDDAPAIAKLLDQAPEGSIDLCAKAFDKALSHFTPNTIYATVMGCMDASVNKERFYPALASSGIDAAVSELSSAAKKGSKAAVKALGNTANPKVIPTLKEIVFSEHDMDALSDYVRKINIYETNGDKKCDALALALEESTDTELSKRILKLLPNTPTSKAFYVAASKLGDSKCKFQAADAVRQIASKCKDDLDISKRNEVLNEAIAVYQSRGGADDGYAVDEIKKLIAESREPSPIFTLSKEEAAQGFEMLFDGTSLAKWTGNTEGYRITNNEIYVTAGYGSGGNLYTQKEYRDFVFRFEFSFVRPGANNGVGVRTPQEVDAAYDGMCEVQILDHDNPIYAGWLQPWQVHGSVYGIVPAKRIVHKAPGEWSEEEIRVVGDHVTVTVNGEVIVDCDIREACQGHNVSPDPNVKNPYTADHKDHPGMFNEKGYVGFLGHGPGVKFRNVRILDLGEKSKKKFAR